MSDVSDYFFATLQNRVNRGMSPADAVAQATADTADVFSWAAKDPAAKSDTMSQESARIAELEDKVARLTARGIEDMQASIADMEQQLAKEQAENVKLNAWKDAIENECALCFIEPTDDARQTLAKIIDWNQKVALDPNVSEDAAKLRDTHLEERNTLMEVVGHLSRDLAKANRTIEDLLSKLATRDKEANP